MPNYNAAKFVGTSCINLTYYSSYESRLNMKTPDNLAYLLFIKLFVKNYCYD